MSHLAARLSLAGLPRERRDDVARRWVADILASYPAEAAALFSREQDPFANPVGRCVRAGAQAIVAALCDGMDPEAVRSGVREIVQVRAVQQFSPAQAVGFVFQLRPLLLEALRAEGGAGAEVTVEELAALDAAVDAVALAAFDVFTECREQVSRLRVEEQKRRVAWIVDHLNRGGAEVPEP